MDVIMLWHVRVGAECMCNHSGARDRNQGWCACGALGECCLGAVMYTGTHLNDIQVGSTSTAHIHGDGVHQCRSSKRLDLLWHGGREHERLPLVLEVADDLQQQTFPAQELDCSVDAWHPSLCTYTTLIVTALQRVPCDHPGKIAQFPVCTSACVFQ